MDPIYILSRSWGNAAFTAIQNSREDSIFFVGKKITQIVTQVAFTALASLEFAIAFSLGIVGCPMKLIAADTYSYLICYAKGAFQAIVDNALGRIDGQKEATDALKNEIAPRKASYKKVAICVGATVALVAFAYFASIYISGYPSEIYQKGQKFNVLQEGSLYQKGAIKELQDQIEQIKNAQCSNRAWIEHEFSASTNHKIQCAINEIKESLKETRDQINAEIDNSHKNIVYAIQYPGYSVSDYLSNQKLKNIGTVIALPALIYCAFLSR